MKSIVLLFAIAAIGTAQHSHHEPALKSGPVELLEGMGKHSHPIATESKLAQQFFDQGLTLVYGFNHDEAARLFARAAELDPKSPMPHWGIALALGPNYNLPALPEREAKAWAAIAKARELAADAPPHEHAYVEALATRYSENPNDDRKQLAVKYKDAMKAVMLANPDDQDAAVLYAEALMNLRPWQLWSAGGVPAEGTLEVLATLERVLRRNPDHPGANHYYIHAVEASKNPERALPSALRLGSLVPGAGHLVHMPSHIFLRLGDFQTSATVNKTASEVDRKYVERTDRKSFYSLMYYSHNLHFVSYARMMQGDFDEALDYSRRLRKNVEGAIDGMPMIASYGAFEWLVLTRFGKWNEMLAESEPADRSPSVHGFYRYSRGIALAGLGRIDEAKAELERLQATIRRIPENETMMSNNTRHVLSIGEHELRARIARAEGAVEAELESLQKAAELQDRLTYMEPPEWHYPVRESLGGALLRSGKFVEAETEFRKDLEANPRNGRSLFGLLESLKAQGKASSAEWVRAEYAEAWKHSQSQLSIADL